MSATPSSGRGGAPATGVRRRAHGLGWYLRGLLGEDAYERYLEHEATHGRAPGDPGVMTAREFWRDRTDRQDREPQGRCC